MSPNESTQADAAQDKVLRLWTVEAPLPPGFQESVWRRISRGESRTEPAVWAGLRRWVEDLLPRPKTALAYCGIVLAAGVAAGALAAQIRNSRVDSDLSARYVRTIAPYQSDKP
jgi:hypothetical protein